MNILEKLAIAAEVSRHLLVLRDWITTTSPGERVRADFTLRAFRRKIRFSGTWEILP